MEELALHILDLAIKLFGWCLSFDNYIDEDSAANLLTISIEDNGRVWTVRTCNQSIRSIYTTRTTRRVGLGLPLLYMTAQQCAVT